MMIVYTPFDVSMSRHVGSSVSFGDRASTNSCSGSARRRPPTVDGRCEGSESAQHSLGVLNDRRHCEMAAHQATPLGKCIRAAKVYRVILHALPIDDQSIPRGMLHRAVQLHRAAAF